MKFQTITYCEITKFCGALIYVHLLYFAGLFNSDFKFLHKTKFQVLVTKVDDKIHKFIFPQKRYLWRKLISLSLWKYMYMIPQNIATNWITL